MKVKTVVKSGVNTVVNTVDIKEEDKDIFIYFINKYKEQNIFNFADRMKFLNIIQKDKNYMKLNSEEEYKLRNYILSDNRKEA